MRLGTRGSALALAQAGLVRDRLARLGEAVEVVTIATSGDERARAAAGPDDKSRFVKEIEEALLAGEIDLAVHSAKDVPGELPDGLSIVGVPERADPRDALCLRARAAAAREQPDAEVEGLSALAQGAVVGTASLRRRAQLLAVRPDLDVREVRGNVDTRLRRLADGQFDALVLAAAGLARLDRSGGEPIPEAVMTPAPGQGCLALEARAADERARQLASRLTDRDSLVALTAERALVTSLGATCRTPVAARARLVEGGLTMDAFAGLPEGGSWVRDSLDGDPAEPAALGRAVAARMLAAGAGAILHDAAAA